MHILALNSDGRYGVVVNKIKEGTWVERYLAGGEFKFIGEDPVHMFETMPIGSLISHTDTLEVMMVETHEVEETLGEKPKVTVSGRGLDRIMLENRIVTRNGGTIFTRGLGIGANGRGYQLGGGSTWNYAKLLLEAYLKTSVENAADSLNNFNVRSEISVSDPEFKKFVFKELETLAEAIDTILGPDNLGLKVERPNTEHTTLDFVIHKGRQMQNYLQFSWFLGDIKNARYLWSNVDYKTAVFVYDQNVTTRRNPAVHTGINSRVFKANASNLEIEFSYPLVNAELDAAYALMLKRANDEIAAAKKVKLVDAEIVENPKLVYNKDYFMGDVLTVLGNYGVTEVMRVTEYAVSFDEQSQTGYPTLSEL